MKMNTQRRLGEELLHESDLVIYAACGASARLPCENKYTKKQNYYK